MEGSKLWTGSSEARQPVQPIKQNIAGRACSVPHCPRPPAFCAAAASTSARTMAAVSTGSRYASVCSLWKIHTSTFGKVTFCLHPSARDGRRQRRQQVRQRLQIMEQFT